MKRDVGRKKNRGISLAGPATGQPGMKSTCKSSGPCGPRARFDPRDSFSATSDSRRQRSGREKKEERKKEKRKRGCALINMSYKNAGVHNLHEPKTESKNRYALSLSSAFLSVWSVSSLCSTDLFRSLSLFLLPLSLSFSPGSPFTG